MTERRLDELEVPYDPSAADRRVAQRRSQLRMRLISLGITIVIMVVVYVWQRAQLQGPGFVIVYALVLLIALAWLAFCVVAYRLARAERADVGTGVALRIDRSGVGLAGTFVPWPEVSGLAAVKGGLGRAERLQLSRSSGEPLSVAFEAIDIRPATIDQTARAYSAGRHGVDLSEFDS